MNVRMFLYSYNLYVNWFKPLNTFITTIKIIQVWWWNTTERIKEKQVKPTFVEHYGFPTFSKTEEIEVENIPDLGDLLSPYLANGTIFTFL